MDDISNSPAVPNALRPRTISMFFLGGLVGYVGMMTAHGNGHSPLLFILGGLILGPLLEMKFASRPDQFRRRFFRRVVVLMLVGGLSFAWAVQSVYANGPQTFATVLGTTPGAGIGNLRAWNQWYDGPNEILAFDADEKMITAIVQRDNGFEENESWFASYGTLSFAEQSKRLSFAMVTPMFDAERLELRLMSNPRWWTKHEVLSSGSTRFTSVIWDATSRQTIVVRGTD